MEITDTSKPDSDPEPADAAPCVSVLNATPDRTVFTEEGNEDGWIATDYSVSLQR
ncbi:hypothetical protein [Halonotius terrestris]|uniref:hypothetical protein n=1 Tax=Halonotius terrestris TaxID=2487750 RepID=UPI00163B63CC|nr:hypothetical protein [Halonotius terrestris]